ncbi:P-loop NTPase fold protein [Spiroplasma endosymbiont of Calodromius spilotus]|uniref:P-loop NTPase fold protein n=1 Tax=Spiroplasma endosymbiont of Calodromius spilotus TaxID=3077929 RepID=UPI0031FEFAB1
MDVNINNNISFIEKRENSEYYQKSQYKVFLRKYISDSKYDGSVLGVFSPMGTGKTSLLKSVQESFIEDKVNQPYFINVNVWNIIEDEDNKQFSLRKKIIKEMHRLTFNNFKEKINYGRRIDYSINNEPSDVHKKHFFKKRTWMVFGTLAILISFAILFILNLHYKWLLVSDSSFLPVAWIFASVFPFMWSQYFSGKITTKKSDQDLLTSNYDYEEHLEALLNRMNKITLLNKIKMFFLNKTKIDKKIVFIFDGLDQITSNEIYEVLRTIRIFLNKNNVKYLILLDEQKMLSGFKNFILEKKQSDDQLIKCVKEYFQYFLRLRPINKIDLSNAFNEYYKNNIHLVALTNQHWNEILQIQSEEENIRFKNFEFKKALIKKFCLWNDNFVYSDVIDFLNTFIMNVNDEIEYLNNYEDLIALLLLTVFKNSFANIYLEICKYKSLNFKNIFLKIKQNYDNSINGQNLITNKVEFETFLIYFEEYFNNQKCMEQLTKIIFGNNSFPIVSENLLSLKQQKAKNLLIDSGNL